MRNHILTGTALFLFLLTGAFAGERQELEAIGKAILESLRQKQLTGSAEALLLNLDDHMLRREADARYAARGGGEADVPVRPEAEAFRTELLEKVNESILTTAAQLEASGQSLDGYAADGLEYDVYDRDGYLGAGLHLWLKKDGDHRLFHCGEAINTGNGWKLDDYVSGYFEEEDETTDFGRRVFRAIRSGAKDAALKLVCTDEQAARFGVDRGRDILAAALDSSWIALQQSASAAGLDLKGMRFLKTVKRSAEFNGDFQRITPLAIVVWSKGRTFEILCADVRRKDSIACLAGPISLVRGEEPGYFRVPAGKGTKAAPWMLAGLYKYWCRTDFGDTSWFVFTAPADGIMSGDLFDVYSVSGGLFADRSFSAETGVWFCSSGSKYDYGGCYVFEEQAFTKGQQVFFSLTNETETGEYEGEDVGRLYLKIVGK